MITRFSRLLVIALALIIFIVPMSAQAAPTNEAPIYPNFVPNNNPEFSISGTSSISASPVMHVGDVLYSSKTFGGSTQIVGHVGIVGPDYLIYHVTPGANGGIGDTLETYMNRHGAGETIQVYKYKNASGENAAAWAKYNYSYAKSYGIEFAKLSVMDPNYCSKFLWQAFFYGEGYDMTGKSLNPSTTTIIYPSSFTGSVYFYYQGSFTV
ncbi:hypothetical protein NSU08_19895 [Paenibacillus sp. FSL H7-0331]